MLSFKQYLQHYPNGHKPKKPNRLFSLRQIKQSLYPKLREDNNPYTKGDSASNPATMSKWDLIKLIAQDEGETVAVTLTDDGIQFDFVSVDIEEK